MVIKNMLKNPLLETKFMILLSNSGFLNIFYKSLGIMGGLCREHKPLKGASSFIKGPLETPPTSRQYGNEGFKWGSLLGPHYVEKKNCYQKRLSIIAIFPLSNCYLTVIK